MPVWKRFNGERVRRGDRDYNKGTWIAEGRVDGQSYKKALPRETVKTAEQARDQDDEIRARIRIGDFALLKDKTGFSDYADNQYLIYINNNLVSVDHKILELNKLKEFFQNRPIKKITPSDCEAFKAWRKIQFVRCQKCENGHEHECSPPLIKPSSVNVELGTLRSLLDRAVADRKIDRNPMDHVRRLSAETYEAKTLAAAARPKLFEALKDDYQLFRICIIGLLTGWRKNQILHLRTSDLTPEKKVWIIRQKKKPKRLVPVHPLVWDILMELSEVRENWLFIHPSGERRKTIDTAWKKAKEAAGVTIRFHDLRHSFTTELSESDPFVTQHALGHSKPETTAGYTHVKDSTLLTALRALKTDDIPYLTANITPSEQVM